MSEGRNSSLSLTDDDENDDDDDDDGVVSFGGLEDVEKLRLGRVQLLWLLSELLRMLILSFFKKFKLKKELVLEKVENFWRKPRPENFQVQIVLLNT